MNPEHKPLELVDELPLTTEEQEQRHWSDQAITYTLKIKALENLLSKETVEARIQQLKDEISFFNTKKAIADGKVEEFKSKTSEGNIWTSTHGVTNGDPSKDAGQSTEGKGFRRVV